MEFSKSVLDLIRQRRSCRTYEKRMLGPDITDKINNFLKENNPGPLGSSIRFLLAASIEGDESALSGLGTYGVIRNPAGFIIGAALTGQSLVDFGFCMERAVLLMQDLGLKTCWLGGSFKKSRFAEKIACAPNESVPAVLSVGYPADKRRLVDRMFRKVAGADDRKPWAELFFSDSFSVPLDETQAGVYAACLEMVRLGPSASNKQPWRIVRESSSGRFHFFLARTPGYAGRSERGGMADLQLVDMGIAACHFELSAKESGLSGKWDSESPNLPDAPADAEHVLTWSPLKK